ncbi:MFS transporter, partial [Bacillus amyloliquefaciens]|nr:MFS transporter [Bacillus amyloliquefaciens]
MLQKDSINVSDGQSASLRQFIDSPEKQKALYKRTLAVVSLSQIFGGAGLAAGVTVG